MLPNEPTNGWNEYRRQVLREFEILHERLESFDKKIDKNTDAINEKFAAINTKLNVLETSMAVLQSKAMLMGIIGGAIATFLLSVLLKYVTFGNS
jgi:hypothetical protein